MSTDFFNEEQTLKLFSVIKLENIQEELEKNWPIFSSCNPFSFKPSAAKDNKY